MAQNKTKEKAKKEALIYLIIFASIGVVATIIGIIVEPVIVVFGLVMIFAGVYLWYSIRKSIKHSFCPKCNAQYNYENDVSWEVANTVETDKKVTAEVSFNCKCAKCGKEQIFKEKFVISQYNEKQNSWTEKNIETLVKNHFIK